MKFPIIKQLKQEYSDTPYPLTLNLLGEVDVRVNNSDTRKWYYTSKGEEGLYSEHFIDMYYY